VLWKKDIIHTEIGHNICRLFI